VFYCEFETDYKENSSFNVRKKPGNAVYSSALPALATGMQYYIIHSRRGKRPLAPGELPKLKIFIYSMHLVAGDGACGVSDHRLSLALRTANP